jgi:ankyrin repeat protein
MQNANVVPTLKVLVDAGANVNRGDRDGRSPLELARARGFRARAAILEQAGAR